MRFFVLIFSVTFLWGLSFPAAKVGLRGVEPFTFLWLRGLFSAGIVFAVMLLRKMPVQPPRLGGGRENADFWINACLHNLMFLTYYHGVHHTTAGRASLFLYAQPLILTGLAAWILPQERVGARAVAGFSAASLGMALLFGDKLSSAGGSTWLGDVIVILAAVLWAAQSVFLKTRLRSFDAFRITAWTQALAVPPFFLIASLRGEPWPDLGDANVLLGVGYNGVIGTGLAMIPWLWLLKDYPAGRVSAFMFLTPVFGVFLGALLLAEPLTILMLGGAALISAGIYLVNSES